MELGIWEVLGRVDRALWLVAAQAGARRGGLIATFVSEASIAAGAPRVLIGIGRAHHTWELIEGSGAFGLHLLCEDNLEWVWRFALESGRGRDKLAGLTLRPGITGSPLLEGALGWLDCRVEARMDAGDRTVYLAEVVDGRLDRYSSPLTRNRLVELAPPDKLEALDKLREEDSVRDAQAIRAWRAHRSAGRTPEAGGG